ncbi:MAG: chorismate mutase [Patescibacteria group bacterium]
MEWQLAGLRLQIDQVDKDMRKLLAERLRLVRKVGEIKQLGKEAVVDPYREKVVLAVWTSWARHHVPHRVAPAVLRLARAVMFLGREIQK